MANKSIFGIFFLLLCGTIYGQHNIYLKAELNDSLKSIYIQQKLEYRNLSSDTLQEIYLNDWINAFSDKRTPLARRFYEDYDRDFHFARQEKRGGTTINTTGNKDFEPLSWNRPPGHPDLISVIPDKPILPGEKYEINLNYSVKIPSEDFTRFGFSNRGKYQLRYWFLTPGVYRNGWQIHSHKNMGDLFIPKLELKIDLILPPHLAAISPLKVEEIVPLENSKKVSLYGRERLETELFLTQSYVFEDIETDSLHVLTNMENEGLNPVLRSLIVRRIIDFLQENLGEYPHDKILSTQEQYSSNPVYGLNQLPKFLRPFPEGFNYDLKQFKTLTQNYLQNTLMLNPREEKWIFDGIQTFLMMQYIEENYPDLKLLGNLSKVIGIRWFHAADLEFNDQYPLLYLYMARQNLDQPLSLPQDSLVKFNKNLANPYKAGAGLKYLESFLSDETVSYSIKQLYHEYQLKPVGAEDFREILRKNAGKDINWFFDDYIGTNEKIDFKITGVKAEDDLLEITVKNKTGNGMPVPLYGLNDDRIIFKTWVENVYNTKKVSMPSKGVETVALNYEGIVPELNQRNNYRRVGSLINKPLQFRLFKDVEDPRYNQLFFMPEVQFNLYDGLSLGAKIYNSTVLKKNFEFKFAPLYGTESKTIVGSAGFTHEIFFEDEHLHAIRYGLSGSRFSYGYDLFYQRLTPYLTMSFRDSPLRNSQKEYLIIRNVNVYRDESPENPLEVADYSVFNVNYSYSNPGLVDHVTGSVDLQVAEQFGKSSFTLEYRKLLQNDRQVNVRFFGGAFFYNDLPGSDYFSFALDRPTDYLFDYNYYGRSETSGVFSQQIIMAEGGFKSVLEPQFANQWISTVNVSTTIWKWVFAYADAGLVKSRNRSAKFLYDSGIRASIIQDHFEIFFPIHSSEGWEFNEGRYDQKIRFIATLDLKTLVGIFTREWF